MKQLFAVAFLAPAMLAGQVQVKLETDEMTGKTNAYAAWPSDSVEGHFGPFQALLMVRCRNGKLDALLQAPGNVPAEKQNQSAVQRAFERQSQGEITIKVKIDTSSRVEPWEVTLSGETLVFRTGVWPGVIDLTKDLAKRILKAQDFLLVRYVSIWGTELTPKFVLGPADSRATALRTVFDTCGKRL